MRNFIIILFILLVIKGVLNVQNPQLFLLAGPSNAVGPGDSLQSPVCRPHTAFEFDAAVHGFIPLKDPVGKAWKLFQKAGTGSVAPAFAKRINELTGQLVYPPFSRGHLHLKQTSFSMGFRLEQALQKMIVSPDLSYFSKVFSPLWCRTLSPVL